MFHLIFPGQGSQQPGMGRYLFEQFQEAKETFEEASDAIKVDLKALCFQGSEADLTLTHNTQPCLLTVSTATQKVLKAHFGVLASVASGHSIGEYAALVAADVLPFATAVRAVRLRGEAMQSAVPVGKGAMAAVMGLNDDQANQLCRYIVEKSGFKPLSPANFNCPGQIVISGSAQAIDWMKANLKPEEIFPDVKRLKIIPLQVSAPFHCDMMKPAEDKMREFFKNVNFADAKFPIIQNFTAKAETSANNLKENLIRQVSAPVLWTQSMSYAIEQNWTRCIECGTGKVLQGLLKKIDSERFQVFNTNSIEDLENIGKSLR